MPPPCRRSALHRLGEASHAASEAEKTVSVGPRGADVDLLAQLIEQTEVETVAADPAEPEVATRQVELAGRGLVQADGSSNESRESFLVDFIVLAEVDCAPGVAFEA
jgi:hypothetical protein